MLTTLLSPIKHLYHLTPRIFSTPSKPRPSRPTSFTTRTLRKESSANLDRKREEARRAFVRRQQQRVRHGRQGNGVTKQESTVRLDVPGAWPGTFYIPSPLLAGGSPGANGTTASLSEIEDATATATPAYRIAPSTDFSTLVNSTTAFFADQPHLMTASDRVMMEELKKMGMKREWAKDLEEAREKVDKGLRDARANKEEWERKFGKNEGKVWDGRNVGLSVEEKKERRRRKEKVEREKVERRRRERLGRSCATRSGRTRGSKVWAANGKVPKEGVKSTYTGRQYAPRGHGTPAYGVHTSLPTPTKRPRCTDGMSPEQRQVMFAAEMRREGEERRERRCEEERRWNEEERVRRQRAQEEEEKRHKKAAEAAALQQQFEMYEAKWNYLKSLPSTSPSDPAHDQRIPFQELPWPILFHPKSMLDFTASTVGEFIFHPERHGVNGKSRRDVVRAELRRWHPDKFEVIVGQRVDVAGTEGVKGKEHVKEVCRVIAGALNELLAREM